MTTTNTLNSPLISLFGEYSFPVLALPFHSGAAKPLLDALQSGTFYTVSIKEHKGKYYTVLCEPTTSFEIKQQEYMFEEDFNRMVEDSTADELHEASFEISDEVIEESVKVAESAYDYPSPADHDSEKIPF